MLFTVWLQDRRGAFAALLLSALLGIAFLSASGCQNTTGRGISADDMVPPLLQLSPGDAVEVSFPGSTNLSGIHRIGPEGTLTMPIVGQVQAAGKTAAELQSELLKLYESELRDKEILVSIVGSANLIYVTGAVLHPGKIALERPLTALEAIMEAGGFTDPANRKKVTIVRYEGDQNTIITLDLEAILSGGPVPPFFVRPRDIVHVPAKVQWF